VKNELSIHEILRCTVILVRLFEKVRIKRWEPTLREDLVEIAQVVFGALPFYYRDGAYHQWIGARLSIEKVGRLLELRERRRLSKFSVVVSLDGYGDIHERVRRVLGI